MSRAYARDLEPFGMSPRRAKEAHITEVHAGEVLERCDPGFFQEPPGGHFWLEHLVRVLAGGSSQDVPWRLYGAGRSSGLQALYCINTQTRYAMFHCVDTAAGGRLLRWALEGPRPEKVLAAYSPLENVLTHAGLHSRITRDHRELFLVVQVGGLCVDPDWRYRIAGEEDIPRLVEYNRLYNAERQTHWTREWVRTVRSHVV